MAKVKCEYCDSYIQDTEEHCPVCGGVNKLHQRTADDTPQTIEDLQLWYKANDLPPEEITRFFIGKNIKEPKAFGIYEEGGIFTVYKNKSDGTRAVRYEGTDEAYAVNEIYLKLKNEILRQKSKKLDKQEKMLHRPKPKPIETYSPSRPNYYGNENIEKQAHKIIRGVGKAHGCMSLISGFITIVIIISIFGSMIAGVGGIFSDIFNGLTSSNYFLDTNNNLYYQEVYGEDDKHVWWLYDAKTGNWSEFAKYNNESKLPDGVVEEDNQSLHDICDKTGWDPDKVDIYESHAFIDAGNHQTPKDGYYYCDDKLYYFINDYYNPNNNTSGWYIINDKTWEYYCDENDKEKLGDKLWYDADEYYIGTNVEESSSYYPVIFPVYGDYYNFEDTDWYHSYEDNRDTYYDDYDSDWGSSNDSGWDSDWGSDWDSDWDSDSDWNSGWNSGWDSGGDWDSDW